MRVCIFYTICHFWIIFFPAECLLIALNIPPKTYLFLCNFVPVDAFKIDSDKFNKYSQHLVRLKWTNNRYGWYVISKTLHSKILKTDPKAQNKARCIKNVLKQWTCPFLFWLSIWRDVVRNFSEEQHERLASHPQHAPTCHFFKLSRVELMRPTRASRYRQTFSQRPAKMGENMTDSGYVGCTYT